MKNKVIFSGNSNHEKAYIVGNATNEIIPNGLIAKVEIKDKLLPCPFCGFRAYAHKMPKIDSYRAYCGNEDCDIQPQTRLCDSREEAVKIWNRRVENERD